MPRMCVYVCVCRACVADVCVCHACVEEVCVWMYTVPNSQAYVLASESFMQTTTHSFNSNSTKSDALHTLTGGTLSTQSGTNH